MGVAMFSGVFIGILGKIERLVRVRPYGLVNLCLDCNCYFSLYYHGLH